MIFDYEQASLDDPRVGEALAEMQATIQSHYPDATFSTFEGFDPGGMYLRASVDVEDTNDVYDLVIDRMIHFLNEERLPVYVVVVHKRDYGTAASRSTSPAAEAALP